MNRTIIKYIIINSLIVIFALISGLIAAVLFKPQLFNKNIEDYLFLLAPLSALPFPFFIYRNSIPKKAAVGIFVYFASLFLIVIAALILALLFFILLTIWCKYNTCSLIF